jgi:hypothetical protein
MNLVTCTVSDSKIWNVEQFIVDLVNSVNYGPVDIDLKHEGPCCQSIKLDVLLDSISGLVVNAIHTSNQISSSKFPEVRNPFVELNLAKEKAVKLIPNSSPLVKKFAIFIGRSNWQRLGLASFLWKYFNNDSLITYHYNNKDDYHRVNFGLETLLQKRWDYRQTVYEFLEHLPLTFDQQTYPILWNRNAFDLDKHYVSLFCEIVCETFFSGKTFMMTEKIFRPIVQRKPFIVQGPKFFLENLKILGFKTFNNWWDESYDIDENDGKFDSLQWTINYIGNQSMETINDWYQQMQPTLDHNVKTLLQLTDNQILTTKFKSK